YRATVPHPGFQILGKWGERMPRGYFVFTSNVDGQFQKAGFPPDRVVEVHGSIDWMQCTENCGVGIFEVAPDDPQPVTVDPGTMRAAGRLPSCPGCGGLARPNILMFGDWGWLSRRSDEQETRQHAWLRGVKRLVSIEIGAGTHIPTARLLGERLGNALIRINLNEAHVPAGQGVSLACGGLAGLQAIAAALR
ncbi:MAG TPA: Sir2 family NAD-dependent protein deacetylase, partial [Accumulibacter sp.]|nr:Sir2 family NAD-dependent protein deacetylase [Accumulibacter sp.]